MIKLTSSSSSATSSLQEPHQSSKLISPNKSVFTNRRGNKKKKFNKYTSRTWRDETENFLISSKSNENVDIFSSSWWPTKPTLLLRRQINSGITSSYSPSPFASPSVVTKNSSSTILSSSSLFFTAKIFCLCFFCGLVKKTEAKRREDIPGMSQSGMQALSLEAKILLVILMALFLLAIIYCIFTRNLKGRKVQCYLCLSYIYHEEWHNGEHRRKCAEGRGGFLNHLPIPFPELRCPKCDAGLKLWPANGQPFRCKFNNTAVVNSSAQTEIQSHDSIDIPNNGHNRLNCFSCDYDICIECARKNHDLENAKNFNLMQELVSPTSIIAAASTKVPIVETADGEIKLKRNSLGIEIDT